MPLRILSGRPRHLQILIASLVVLCIGVATALGRPSGSPATLETAAAYAGGDIFNDVPPSTSPLAADPPSTAPAAPVTDPTTAPAPVPDRGGEAAPPVAGPAIATPPAAPAAPPAPAAPKTIVPVGKGMWLYQLSMAEGGDAVKVVNKAKAAGLTHVYLRLGSSKGGFYDQPELDKLLPVAHAAGLKVVGWDFVYLDDPAADAPRAKSEINYVTPTGHKIDAFSADIETSSEGVSLSADRAAAYGAALRSLVGQGYPLIATVPRPSAKRPFPFAE